MVAPWDIYAERLFPLAYGHPLWAPEPSHEYGEVRIGDVGFLLNGRFRFLFNCTREARDPLDSRGTPTPFRPFTIPPGSVAENSNEITQPLLQSQGMHSVSAQGQGTIGDPSTGAGAQAGLRYRCTEPSGALLILKQAGYATRLDCTCAVQEYMLQNLEHWYLFATDRLGIDLRESDLLFVYGHIKTTVWAEAAFTSSSTDSELSISTSVPTLGASGIFSVELSNRQIPTIFQRWGPPGRVTSERGMDALITLPSPSVEDVFDQCIFLNYFKMKRRFRKKMVVRAAAGPHELPRSPPEDPPREFDEAQDGNASDLASQILDYILELARNVEYAWTSDQDICRMLAGFAMSQDYPNPLLQKPNAAVESHDMNMGTLPHAHIVTNHGVGSLTWEPDSAQLLGRPPTSPTSQTPDDGSTRRALPHRHPSEHNMSLHKSRTNPPKPYAERMTETRAEVRRFIRDALSSITGQGNATMKWAHDAYMKDVVTRYRVRLEGWPLEEVPFKNLSDVQNLQKLELLLRDLHNGTIRFVRMTEEQYQVMLADPSPWIGHQDNVGEEGDMDEC